MGGHRELLVELEAAPGVDDEELAHLTGRLRGELLELDVDAVEPLAQADAPAGAKGVEALALGGMLVRFVLHMDVLSSIVRAVQAWLQHQRASSVKLTLDGDTLEVIRPSSVEQDRLIDMWISRHASAGP